MPCNTALISICFCFKQHQVPLVVCILKKKMCSVHAHKQIIFNTLHVTFRTLGHQKSNGDIIHFLKDRMSLTCSQIVKLGSLGSHRISTKNTPPYTTYGIVTVMGRHSQWLHRSVKLPVTEVCLSSKCRYGYTNVATVENKQQYNS